MVSEDDEAVHLDELLDDLELGDGDDGKEETIILSSEEANTQSSLSIGGTGFEVANLNPSSFDFSDTSTNTAGTKKSIRKRNV